jgi:ABC-type transporter Mla subunit MlaD
MLWHLALIEDDVLGRIYAARNKRRSNLTNVGHQFRWLLRNGDSVKVNDAIDAIVRLLQGDKPADGAQIITKMQVARRLNAREHALRKE